MKLRYNILKVKDLQRAKSFYIQLLGMQPTKEERDRMIVFDLGNVKIGLYNPLADGYALADVEYGNNCYICFGVDEIEPELKRISAFAEIVSHKKVDYHEWVEFKDSEGNMLEIHKI
ncbi:MAG: VOC family protein [candidate division SR1 bacterium]|nr:VOC family protein [candidate division SR1 bacterium]